MNSNYSANLIRSQRFSRMYVLCLVLLLMGIISCSKADQDSNEQKGGTTTTVNLLKVADGPFSIDDYKGKKLMVVYSATWCPPCVAEAPIIQGIHKRYGGDNFSVIGVSVDKSPVLVEKFINKLDIDYPLFIEDDSLQKVFGSVFGLPTIFLVDGSGVIIQKHTGALPEDVLLKEVKEFIEQ